MKKLMIILLLLLPSLLLKAQQTKVTLSVDQVQAITDIHQLLPGFMQYYNIVEFEITSKKVNSNNLLLRHNTGSSFEPDLLQMIMNAGTEDLFWFDNIVWNYNGKVQRSSLSLKITEDR